MAMAASAEFALPPVPEVRIPTSYHLASLTAVIACWLAQVDDR